jgi:hypothetical protein
MPARNQKVQVVVNGGLNTEESGGLLVPLEPLIQVPYLTQATNVLYEGTSIRKVGGALKATAGSVFDDTAIYKAILPGYGAKDVTGLLVEVFTIDSNGAFSIIYVNGNISNNPDTGIFETTQGVLPDADGSTPDTTVGGVDKNFVTNSDWHTTAFEDYLIIASSNVEKGVQLLNGPSHTGLGNFSQLASGEPHFAFSEVHQNRLWAAGDPDNPSRLYYSDLNDPTQGYASNFFDIDPAGSAAITALKVYRDRLFIFKGPENGAIYTLSGRTPATFALDPFSKTIGCVSSRAVTEFADDVMFMDTTGHLRTLATTDKYGDFEATIITDKIRDVIDTITYRPNIQATNITTDAINSRVWVQIPTGPEDRNKTSLVIDYSQNMRLSICNWVECASVVHINTQDNDSVGLNKTGHLFGIADKYLWELDVVGYEYIDRYTRPRGESRVYTTEAYTAYVELPSLKFAPVFSHNTIGDLCISTESVERLPTTTDTGTPAFEPEINVTFKWQRDQNAFESVDLNQTFGSRLGVFTYDETEFILGASRLGGPKSVETYATLESADFRRITFAFEQGGLGEGLHVHSFAISIGIDDSGSTENQ